MLVELELYARVAPDGSAWTVGADGAGKARLHCHFARLLIHSMPDPLRYSVALFLKRPRGRTLDAGPLLRLSLEKAAGAVWGRLETAS